MEAINLDNYMPAPAQQKSVTTEAMVGRQAQEVKVAMQVAKMFPRDVHAAYGKIMESCSRRILAESAAYEFPRGGSKISGPSIRLAEVLAQNWGNIDYGILELENKNGESTVMSYAWDLETNTRRQMVFSVKHERKAKGSINKLDDPRDIYEMVANQGSRRVRACILGVIPGDIVEAAMEKCNQTLLSGNDKPLSDRVREMIAIFGEKFSVNKEMIEKFLGCKSEAFSEQDLIRLKKIGASLRDGMAKREDYFEIKITSAPKETSSNVSDEFEEYLKNQGKGGAESDPNQSELPLE